MPPKWVKNSEPEDKQMLCGLDVKQKLSASTPRIKRKLVPHCLTQHNILHKRYYNLWLADKYLVQTWSQTKSSRKILPEVHGVKKILDTNPLPEKQKTAPQLKKGSEIKLRLGQGRVGIRCKKKPKLQKILMNWQTNCRKYWKYLQPKT